MCIPMAVGLGMMAASTAFSAYSAGQQASAQNREAEFNARVAQNNADISRQEGKYAIAASQINASKVRRTTDHKIGTQRAQMGASGAVVDSGSFMEVTMDTAEGGEREAQTLLHEGNMEMWRKENEARGHMTTAQQFRNSKVSVGSAVAGAIMGGIGQLGSMAVMNGSKSSGDTGKTNKQKIKLSGNLDAEG